MLEIINDGVLNAIGLNITLVDHEKHRNEHLALRKRSRTALPGEFSLAASSSSSTRTGSFLGVSDTANKLTDNLLMNARLSTGMRALS